MTRDIKPGDSIVFRAPSGIGMGTAQMRDTVTRVDGDTLYLKSGNPKAARRSSVVEVYKGGLPPSFIGGPLEDDI